MRRATSILLLFAVAMGAAAAALAAAPKGSRAKPYAVHTFAGLPQSRGWKLRVNKTVPNATRAILKWNKYNAPPRAGDQFFMINITLGYSGEGRTSPSGLPRRRFDSPVSPNSFSAVGRSNITYTTITDSCGSVPGALNFGWRVRSGRTVSGNICFSISKTDVRGLLLKYESVRSLHPKAVFFKLR
jgi:hypothetical protein